jgi:hypothetical protein
LLFDIQVAFIQLRKALPGSPVCGYFRILDPGAARVLVKIDTGIYILIDVVDAEARTGLAGWSRLRKRRDGHKHEQDEYEVERTHLAFSLSCSKKTAKQRF